MPEFERVKVLREAAGAVAAWDQPQDHWPEELRCDRPTVRRLAAQLRAMAESAERRLTGEPHEWCCDTRVGGADDDCDCADAPTSPKRCRRCTAIITLVPALGSEGAQWYQSGMSRNANGFDCQSQGRPHEPSATARPCPPHDRRCDSDRCHPDCRYRRWKRENDG